MKIMLAVLGLAALGLALAYRTAPPQPSVLIDVPDPSLDPIHDLDLNGATND